MALFAAESGKQFTKPNTGKYIGTIIDIVDLGLCAPKNTNNPAFKNEPVHRIQVIWNIRDAEGNVSEYSEAPPLKLGEGGGKYKPTRLFTIVSGVLQGAPPKPFALFDVESMIGKSNELFIVKTGDGNEARSEIAGFLPVPPGVTPPGIPAGYTRKPHKTQNYGQTAPAAQPVQSQPAPSTQYAQAPQAQNTQTQEVKF